MAAFPQLSAIPKAFGDALFRMFAGTSQVISGLAITPNAPGSLQVNVAGGEAVVNGVRVRYVGGNVLPGGVGVLARIDIIRIASGAGVPSVLPGVAAAAPVEPALPAGDLYLGQVFIPGGAIDYTTGGFVADYTMPKPARLGIVNLLSYADGDGVVDDRLAIAAAIAATPTGGMLYVPTPSVGYRITDDGTQCILINKNIRIFGADTLGSLFIVDAAVGATRDVIRLSTAPFGFEFFQMDNIRLAAAAGTPARHAVHLDLTAAGSLLSRLHISNCYLSQFGGDGIHLSNPIPNANGLFTSLVESSNIYGGVNLQNAGDNVKIRDVSIPSGGITISTVFGSALVVLEEINAVGRGGILISGQAQKITLNRVNWQPAGAYNGAGAAIIDFSGVGGSGRILDAVMRNCLALVAVGATDTVRFDTVTNIDMDDCQITTQSGRCLVITANAQRARIGRSNTWLIAGGGTERSIAAGVDVTYDSAPLHYSQVTVSATIANTAVQTAFNRTYTIPANTLKLGDLLRIRACGQTAIAAATGVTITVRVNGVNACSAVIPAAAAAGVWAIEADLLVRVDGAGGVYNRGFGLGHIGGVMAPNALIGSTALNMTVAQVVDVTVQFTVANPGNTAELDDLSVEILKGGQTS